MTQKSLDLYSEAEWERIRRSYADSIMKESEIAKLGQSLGISWPFKGAGETPEKYIEYDFEELHSVPGLIGKKRRIKTLIRILDGMLDFDDPFSDMADSVEAGNEIDDTFEKIIIKLDIPTKYPARFLHFSNTTLRLFVGSNVQTLLEVIHFAQKVDPTNPDGEELRIFLNGLAHNDEAGLAKHLPYRKGVGGLHLAEAIYLVANDLELPVQLELLKQYGDILSAEEDAVRQKVTPERVEAHLSAAMKQVSDLCNYFFKDAAKLKELYEDGNAPERFFIMIDNHRLERVCVSLVRTQFEKAVKSKAGLLGKLSKMFGR